MDVVPLAIQLVGSVRHMRRFLHSVSQAPGELKRLIDLLEQLELILEQVGMLVQRQQENTKAIDSGMVASVLRATKTCEDKLTSLEGIAEASKSASATSSRATRALGSFRLVYKKKELEEIEQQVYEAVNLLTLTMMANLT